MDRELSPGRGPTAAGTATLGMLEPDFCQALRDRRQEVKGTWERLLLGEKAVTPLGDPRALVHLLDATLGEFYANVEACPVPPAPGRAGAPPACACGRNPFLAYFAAGSQAVRESVIFLQATGIGAAPGSRVAILAAVDAALRKIQDREMVSFCSLCQFRFPGRPAAHPAGFRPRG